MSSTRLRLTRAPAAAPLPPLLLTLCPNPRLFLLKLRASAPWPPWPRMTGPCLCLFIPTLDASGGAGCTRPRAECRAQAASVRTPRNVPEVLGPLGPAESHPWRWLSSHPLLLIRLGTPGGCSRSSARPQQHRRGPWPRATCRSCPPSQIHRGGSGFIFPGRGVRGSR